jgi:hypothetical protein
MINLGRRNGAADVLIAISLSVLSEKNVSKLGQGASFVVRSWCWSPSRP